MENDYLEAFINNAISEDVGEGDHTSQACIPENTRGKLQLLIKDTGILAGVEIAQMIFRKLDPEIIFNRLLNDGHEIKPGDVAFIVEGNATALLKSERLVLNVMQRMSGIATMTNKYVSEISGYNTKILDTRKTTPGMRILEKMAVKIGGGENHRYGLYDMILIKDNHIDLAGGIYKALERTRDYIKELGKKLKIEIEARNIEDVREILKIGNVDRILLDNFSIEDTREAVRLINGKHEIESSGNITLKNIRSYAECRVDYISVGELTHHITSLDMSLKYF
jgi:nicotinate-nucleotide pyrophosphorylase (carboxylating)